MVICNMWYYNSGQPRRSYDRSLPFSWTDAASFWEWRPWQWDWWDSSRLWNQVQAIHLAQCVVLLIKVTALICWSNIIYLLSPLSEVWICAHHILNQRTLVMEKNVADQGERSERGLIHSLLVGLQPLVTPPIGYKWGRRHTARVWPKDVEDNIEEG